MILVVAVCAPSPIKASSPAAPTLSNTIVISQVYGGGGNAGAQYQSDFIELFNRGSVPAMVTGWSVQYAAAAGFAWSSTLITGTINPGRYFLVKLATGSGCSTLPCGAPLPAPDATGTSAMSASNGKVALVASATPLTCGVTAGDCLPNASIIDLVGYGTANNYEGAAAPGLSNTTAAIRNANGCAETDANNADFASSAPTPRNSATAAAPCGQVAQVADLHVTKTGPASAPINASVVFTLSLANSGTTTATGVMLTDTMPAGFVYASDTSPFGAPTISGQNLVWNITSLSAGPTYAFTLTLTAPGAPAIYTNTLAATTATTETYLADNTASATTNVYTIGATRIHDVQGAAHRSPMEGMTVSGIPGIVTAVRTTSFYVQDPAPDADPATSEAILVFVGAAPSVSVGDSVVVGGVVNEFRSGGATSNDLTITEIGSPSVAVLSHNNALPSPTVLGIGGRAIPALVIEDDATGDVETSGSFDPATDGIDFYESLEAMLVQVNNAVAVGPTTAFGETPVLADDGISATLRTYRGGIAINASDFNPERIILDDALIGVALTDMQVGDHVTTPVTGVLDYSFSNYKILVAAPVSVTPSGIAKESVPAAGWAELAVATMNTENLDVSDGAAKFAGLASIVVNNLAAPDLVCVQEVQDNNGATNDSIVDASLTWTTLITAISTAGGPAYQYRQIDPVDGADGGEPGGNIRQGFLFRTDRGLSFVDRAGGASTASTSVLSGASGPQLSFSPGRINPTNSAFSSSRKPLAGEFSYNGKTLFAIANHFNSKGGDQPLFGHFQPPVRSSETTRGQQAALVGSFVSQIEALDAQARIVVCGDLNDYEFSGTLTTLTSGGRLENLTDRLPLNARYTYVYEGNSQTLDHILVSPGLAARTTITNKPVHVNAEFLVANRLSDHDPQWAMFNFVKRVYIPLVMKAAQAGW